MQQQKTFSLKKPPLCSLLSHHPQLALYINAPEFVNVVNICSNIPDRFLRKHIQFPIFKDQGVAESTAPFCTLFRTNGIHCMGDRESCQRVRAAIVGGRLLPRKVCFTRVVLLRRGGGIMSRAQTRGKCREQARGNLLFPQPSCTNRMMYAPCAPCLKRTCLCLS